VVYSESKLTVADNSGAKNVKCIRILSSKNGDVGNVGNLLLTKVVKKNHSKKIKKKNVILWINRYDKTTDLSLRWNNY